VLSFQGQPFSLIIGALHVEMIFSSIFALLNNMKQKKQQRNEIGGIHVYMMKRYERIQIIKSTSHKRNITWECAF